MAHDAMAAEDIIASNIGCGSMTAWSLEAMTEIKPKFTKCLRDGQGEARLERSTSVGYAGQV